MHLVIFGLTLSSSWGNGHATLWRGLLKCLGERGHHVVFYEKNVPYYAETRDDWDAPNGVRLRLYDELASIATEAMGELSQADAAFVTSYCPDGPLAAEWVCASPAKAKVFYDLDTPVTLDALDGGAEVAYLPKEGLRSFDLVLSYTGGLALDRLCSRLGAKRVAPLYGWVDPEVYRPVPASDDFRSELSYLGTFAADRQPALGSLFVSAAGARPEARFLIGGAMYPREFPWKPNIYFVRHVPPSQHAPFFCSSRTTLNVTRRAMAEYGYCPSGRLFEAAACGVAILSDVWDGLDCFFELGSEILPVRNAGDVLAALSLSDTELRRIAEAGRVRALEHHSAAARALELERLLESVTSTNPEQALTCA